VFIGVWFPVEKGFRRDDEPGSADAALEGSLFEEGPLERMKLVATGDALDRDEFRALGFDRENTAGVHKAAVENDAAGAAVAVVAAFLGADQSELVAEHFEQALTGLAEEFDIVAVEAELDLGSAHG